MKKNMMIMVAGLGLLVAGCTTQSPYVGTWEGHVGEEPFLLNIAEEGNFVVYTETGDGKTRGSWNPLDKKQVEFVVDDDPKKIVGNLVNDDELVVSSEGESVKFTKK